MFITDATLKKEIKEKIDHQVLFIVPEKIKQVYTFQRQLHWNWFLGKTIIRSSFFPPTKIDFDN